MMKYKLNVTAKKLLADTLTPVNIYLKLRDVFSGSILLESSDYHGQENSLSLICCQPIASYTLADHKVSIEYPDKKTVQLSVESPGVVESSLNDFKNSFEVAELNTSFSGGLFGYMTYDSVKYFEDVQITSSGKEIPDIIYKLYRFVIVINHFSNELTILEFDHEGGTYDRKFSIDKIEQLIFSNRFSTFKFKIEDDEQSFISDNDFLEMVKSGMQHCFRGDVFQIVLSRRFSRKFKGDEFNVYRSLRSINPSPYLFYFDYGSFKLMGSSPEAQLQIRKNKAYIFPIAGTFRRSGNDKEDAEAAARLASDEKENAEHVMLVDLARNDMSRNSEQVTVEVFKEIQYYSHVIHLVSKVTGIISDTTSAIRVAADTFPAGTLSGAPKHKAMNLINKIEKSNRGYYGGAIGFLGFDGSYNHAIMIRTLLSKENTLTYQAGAGVVSKSVPQNELQEVKNKLEALRKAIDLAEKI